MAWESFEDLADALGLPESAVVWRDGWETSRKRCPDAIPEFFTRDCVETACDSARISDEVRRVFVENVSHFASDERLCRLGWHLHRLLVDPPGMAQRDVRSWPLLPEHVVGGSDLFFGYLFLGCVPRLAAWYGARGIPREVFVDTLSDVELWVREHRRKTGRWGLSEHKWLVHHFSGNLFKLGRLQFQFGSYRYPYHAWRHQDTGRVVLLAGADLHFSADGMAAGSDPRLPLDAPYHVGPAAVRGRPIDPRGFAREELVELPLSQWSEVLSAGDPVLNLHIPAGGPMDFADCGESFERAREFFPTYFPGFGFRAIVCGSWLLDPQLEQALGPRSNIARFLQEVYLFPLRDASGQAMMARVFGTTDVDPETAPRDTSLRRAILEHLDSGGAWRAGGCVLFPGDLSWGDEVYRRFES